MKGLKRTRTAIEDDTGNADSLEEEDLISQGDDNVLPSSSQEDEIYNGDSTEDGEDGMDLKRRKLT